MKPRGRSGSARHRGVGGAGAERTCPSRVAVGVARGPLRGGRRRCDSASGSRPHLWRGRAAMAYSTLQRVALASGVVLAVSLLLPKVFLSRGKRQGPAPAPGGKRGPAPLERPASPLPVGMRWGEAGVSGPHLQSRKAGWRRQTWRRLGGAKPRSSLGFRGQGGPTPLRPVPPDAPGPGLRARAGRSEWPARPLLAAPSHWLSSSPAGALGQEGSLLGSLCRRFPCAFCCAFVCNKVRWSWWC